MSIVHVSCANKEYIHKNKIYKEIYKYLPHDESGHRKRTEDRQETQHGSRVKAETTKQTES